MDIFLVVLGLIIAIRAYKRSDFNDRRRNLLLIASGVLILVGVYPFAHKFATGFQKGFERGVDKASQHSSATDEVSEEEMHTIVTSITECWNESNITSINIHLLLNPDTSIKNISVIDAEKARYNNDIIYRETADRAINALKACGPMTFLPKGKYRVWNEMELIFESNKLPQ